MTFDVLDWRRRVHELYSAVRAETDVQQAHSMWTQVRDELLMNHPSSPVPEDQRAHFGGADITPYDDHYRYVVDVQPSATTQTREVTTGTDGVVRFECLGFIDLPELGTLDVWRLMGYAGGLFLPIRDGDPRSYGGGRYVLDTVKGADLGGNGRRLVVDLNFAYQPSCAYDPAWACPLAGPSNTISAPVVVGEKYRAD